MSRSIDVPAHLVNLLYLRAVWELSGPTGLPPAGPPACAPEPLPAGITPIEASAAWLDLWNAGIEWQDRGFPPATTPPGWRGRFGPTGLESKARDWTHGREAELWAAARRGWSDVGLRNVLDEAEEHGVHDYVLLPLAEPWALWTSDERVVMSGSIFGDKDLLRRYSLRG